MIAAVFVLPHWRDYQFYNWQMSVTRKPSYDLALGAAAADVVPDPARHLQPDVGRAGPRPAGAWGILARWRRAPDAERLLLLWVAVGSLELLVHDVGNERRLVFLIPALVALASLVLTRGSLLPEEASRVPRRAILFLSPVILYSAYVLAGPLARMPFLAEVHAHALSHAVRLAAAAALVLGAAIVVGWPRLAATAGRGLWTPFAANALVWLFAAWNLVQFGEWALNRTYENYEASLALGRALPPGTLIQGKLANGLALENRIRPIFIGHEFGNYADRKQRWRCAVYFDVYGSGDRLRRGPDSGCAGRVSGLADHHDLRRRGNALRPRSSCPDREACAPLMSAPSRRTPTCGSAPNTTTRCSSITGARRSSRFSNAPASPCADGCSTPAAAAAACRCRSPKRRARSSASIRSTGSATRASGSRASAGCRACTSPSPTAWRSRFRAGRSTWCCLTP